MTPERETAAPSTEPEAPAPIPSGPTAAPLVERVLALQRTAGNRAVAALARAPTQVRERIREARLGGRAPYTGLATFEFEFTGDVCQLTLKVRLRRDRRVTEAEQQTVEQQTAAEFARIWDNKFELTDTSTNETFPLRMNLEFVGSGQHKRIALHRGAGRDDEDNWFVESLAIDRAHELGHVLGPNDEYVDRTVVRRRTATSPDVHRDYSIMGQYYEEGTQWAEAKLRHGENIAARIARASGRTLTVRLTTGFLIERGERYREHERALGEGAERDAVTAERQRIEDELEARTGYGYWPATI